MKQNMAGANHENSELDIDLGYEQNRIELKGIIYFSIGLFLLIVITFVLMALLFRVMEDEASVRLASQNPLQLTDNQRLPPEPRLQAAPGFGVEAPDRRVNLELQPPASEYIELKKQWDDLVKNGRKDPQTGTVIAMPIDEAIDELLKQGVKVRSKEGIDTEARDALRYLTDASSGRKAAAARR